MMNRIQHKTELWKLCKTKGQILLGLGLDFFAKGKLEEYNNIQIFREEVAVNARFLHRGYYCPSPVQEFIVSNSRRGKLLLRPTNRSRISHRYAYDLDDRLVVVEATLPDGTKKLEYLVYGDGIRYGFAFDSWGSLVGVSEEVFDGDKLVSYFCGSCYNHVADGIDFGITTAHYEKYYYDADGLKDVDYYFTNLWCDSVDSPDDVDIIIQGGKYRFVRENGYLVGFYTLNFDGEPFDSNPYITPISKPKKAH